MPIPSVKGLFGRSKRGQQTTYPDGPDMQGRSAEKDDLQKDGSGNEKVRLFRPYTFAVVLIVSLGGLIFGFDTGQISGFLEMEDFLERFHDQGTSSDPMSPDYYSFSNVVSGTIVGLLSIGTLFGALLSAPVADRFGRRVCIVFWNAMFVIGVIIQMTSTRAWYQVALGRWVAGLGVGGLSVLTPMYQSETAPRQIRGSMVGCYQLFITLGIFIAYAINYRTERIRGNDGASWRIPMGVGFIWPLLMVIGIAFLPESPRWDYRHNNIERARRTISRSYGVPINHWEVEREMREIKEKYDAEFAGGGKHVWYEIFTGPRMAYRTLLGVTLQALQQLTGANFFFYFGTTIFRSVGIDSYITSMILGAVNFVMTFPGILLVVEKAGRRKALMWGAGWMFMCFMVFSSVGHFALDQIDPSRTPQAGTVMIVFACLFIAGYAMTWGPVIWVVVGELFPTRYRTMCMGISSASNWIWNFLISFFTSFITASIDYQYGYIFAACCAVSIPVVYFFLEEHQGRTLEEIETMYLLHVPPPKSSKWIAPEGEDLVTADNLYLDRGARSIRKQDAAGMEGEQRLEKIPSATAEHGIHDVSGSAVPESSGARGASISG
ncbi:related to MFS monosaccharide transporter [Ramularia collo-cygni]|uniref:Related to MFS monosaccharide transporter n=1 Tax=Ramularia collo-cygni TaxID=112498 RepID=A0A2D3VDT3_9PEZI|nr:related to MFS monosaccharide transporter [Ramularia collo-cygni]CZT20974.1 related to MFS monosaccharide transporter [Ramularia collo-cygni]